MSVRLGTKKNIPHAISVFTLGNKVILYCKSSFSGLSLAEGG